MSIGTVSASTLAWAIPSIRECLISEQTFISSPDFHLSDSSWYLKLDLILEEWIGIFLHRGDSGPPKTIKYTIKIKGRTDVVEFTKTSYFDCKHASSGELFLKKEIDWNSIFRRSCTIICYITYDTRNPVARKEFVTCAVQTEVANSAIEKESTKDVEWLSLDMKGVALLTESMKELLIKGGDHDVTIYVQNKKFRAHRSILSSRSPVFAMMLTHDTKENNTGTINIEDCDPESFDEFLLYVYSGRTGNLTPSNALQLYYPADKYDFPVLKEWCVSILKTSLSVSSICDVVLLAAKHQEKELLKVATEFFTRNIKKILITIGWQNFLLRNPLEANELYIKCMDILHPEN